MADKFNNSYLKKIYQSKLFWPALLWSLFLAVGAVHEISEMPYLKSISLSNMQISSIISSWGIGSLAAFFVKHKHQLPDHLAAIIFGVCFLSAFTFNYYPLILIGFFCAGFSYSFLIGNIRNKIHHAAKQQGISFVEAWGTIEKVTLGINIIFLLLSVYLFAYSIKRGSIYLLIGLTLIFCFTYLMAINKELQRPEQSFT